MYLTKGLLKDLQKQGKLWSHSSARSFGAVWSGSSGIFLPFWIRDQGLLNLEGKSIWTNNLGKLELDHHFKWIKNIYEISSVKLLWMPI